MIDPHDCPDGAPWLRKIGKPICPPPDRCADKCDDQLPIFSRVGRGIKGDSLDAEIVTDDAGHKHLVVKVIDEATGEYMKELDEIVDGGILRYYYNLQPFNDPATFTITFVYDHPDDDLDWQWTTPAIPYLWNAADPDHPDDFIGTGVGTLFLKKTSEDWQDAVTLNTNTPHTIAEAGNTQEKLLYPLFVERDYLNAPAPGDAYTVNLTYGIGGDIDAPNKEDLAKIIGVSPEYIAEIVDERDIPTVDFGHDAQGHPYNVKEYIDMLEDEVEDLKATIADLVGKIYNTTINLPNTGTSAITWGDGWSTAKIPEANLNVFGGTNNPPSNKYADAIRSRTLTNNDITFQ